MARRKVGVGQELFDASTPVDYKHARVVGENAALRLLNLHARQFVQLMQDVEARYADMYHRDYREGFREALKSALMAEEEMP